jgi:calcineurin-like phosphoesterase family protein
VHNSGNNVEQQNRFNLLGKMAMNIGVDINNYSPISIEQIIRKIM